MFFKPKFSYVPLRYVKRFSSNTTSCFKMKEPATLSDPSYLLKVAGLFAFALAPIAGIYFTNKNKLHEKIIAPQAPLRLKDRNDPNRLVLELDELEEHGKDAGLHGRANPQKKRHKTSKFVGFLKESAEGKKGFLNEIIYHRLAEKIFGDLHPRIKIIEKRLEDSDLSEYYLCIESLGSNEDLLTYAETQSKSQNIQDLASLKIEHLGRSVAFVCLILSCDAFMKNYVVRKDGAPGFYPIDFEIIDEDQQTVYVNFQMKSAQKAAQNLITKGGIMDYKAISELNELEQKRIRAGGNSDVGTGLRKFGNQFYDLLERSCADEIENGLILDMYRSIAEIEESDIDDIVDDCTFLMTEADVVFYKKSLLHLVQKTKQYLATFDHSAENAADSSLIKK